MDRKRRRTPCAKFRSTEPPTPPIINDDNIKTYVSASDMAKYTAVWLQNTGKVSYIYSTAQVLLGITQHETKADEEVVVKLSGQVLFRSPLTAGAEINQKVFYRATGGSETAGLLDGVTFNGIATQNFQRFIIPLEPKVRTDGTILGILV